MTSIECPPASIPKVGIDRAIPYSPAPERFVKTPESLLFGRPDLTPTEVLCLLAIKSFDWDGTGSWPSNGSLRKACRLRDPGGGSLRRLLAGLVRKGHIRIERTEQSPANKTGRVLHLLTPAATASTPVRRGTRPERVGALRIDSGEPDPNPLNVSTGSADAMEEDGKPQRGAAILDTEAAEFEPPERCPERCPESAIPAELPPVPPVHPTPTAHDRERAAHEIIRKCHSWGWQIGPDGSLDVAPALRGLTEEPTDQHRELLRAVLPEVLAIRFGVASIERSSPAPATSTGPSACHQSSDQGRPAPPVSRAAQAQVRKLVGQLAAGSDSGITETTVGRAIADALDDRNPTSQELFFGLARSIRKKTLPEDVFLSAFDCACGRHVRNRGAAFTACVKRLARKPARIQVWS